MAQIQIWCICTKMFSQIIAVECLTFILFVCCVVISYKVNDLTSGIIIEPCHVYGCVCLDTSIMWHWVKHLKMESQT